MKVFWSATATADLTAIHAYIANHSPRFAASMVRRILDRTDDLARHPQLGGVVPEYGIESLRQIVEGPYRVIYQVADQRIEVLTIIHGARNMPPRPPHEP